MTLLVALLGVSCIQLVRHGGMTQLYDSGRLVPVQDDERGVRHRRRRSVTAFGVGTAWANGEAAVADRGGMTSTLRYLGGMDRSVHRSTLVRVVPAFLTLLLASSTALADGPSETRGLPRLGRPTPDHGAWIEGDRPGMYVEVRDPDHGWRRVCSVPCRLPPLGAGFAYRVDGDFLASSREFTVLPSTTRVHVNGASVGNKIGGGVLAPVGGFAMLVGVAGLELCQGAESCMQSGTILVAGLAGLVAGIALLVGGRTTIDAPDVQSVPFVPGGLPLFGRMPLGASGFVF